MTDDEHYVTGTPYNEPDDDDNDFEEQYNTGDWGCPPHLLALCGLCGYNVCSNCDKHRIDGEDVNECPASRGT